MRRRQSCRNCHKIPRALESSSPIPAPISYELRIGVTGHQELDDPPAVALKVRELLVDIVGTLTSASEKPFGVSGRPRSRINRVDRRLTEILGFGTRVVAPLLDVATRPASSLVRAMLRAPSHTADVGRCRADGTRRLSSRTAQWPRVPVSPREPATELRTPLKLTAISSLAKGADQIVAREVYRLVEQPEKRVRPIEAVLPFPAAQYERDFTDPNDFKAFQELLQLDRDGPTVIFPKFPDCQDPDDPTCTLSRDKAYSEAGRHVVDSSEIVLAVWDPTHQETPAGAGMTTRYALERGRVVLWLNPKDLDTGPLLLRLKPEFDSDPPVPSTSVGRAWQRFWHLPPGEPPLSGDLQNTTPRGCRIARVPSRAKALSVNFHRLAAYNRDAAIDRNRFEQELKEATVRLSETAVVSGLPDAARTVIVEALLPHVVRADHLGQHYRELRDFSARLWPTAAACVVTVMAAQIIFMPTVHQLAYVELGILLVGYLFYRVSLHDEWHQKWLHDRRLAEGLRGALYASLVRNQPGAAAGSSRASGSTSRIVNPLPFYSPVNAWFVATMKRVLAKERRRFAKDLNLSDAGHRRAVAKFLRDAWVCDQAVYHARHAARETRVVERSRQVRLGLIAAIALVAVLHALGTGHVAEDTPVSWHRLDLWVAFATIALPAWTAAVHVMLSLDDHERLAERSAHMAPLLIELAGNLDGVQNAVQLEQCVGEAERILDLESAEWAESLADRKPEFTG